VALNYIACHRETGFSKGGFQEGVWGALSTAFSVSRSFDQKALGALATVKYRLGLVIKIFGAAGKSRPSPDGRLPAKQSV
jgi:hypothetical protein